MSGKACVPARAALDAGDGTGLTAILDEHPDVLHHRCFAGECYERGYFPAASLLHHVAGDPIRCRCRRTSSRSPGCSTAARRAAVGRPPAWCSPATDLGWPFRFERGDLDMAVVIHKADHLIDILQRVPDFVWKD